MQTLIKIIFLIVFTTSFAQNKKQETNSIGTDVLNASYSVFNNVLLKKDNQKTYTYKNIYLGDIYSVDLTNSQEIVVFYNNFNTVIVLDNQLNEIQSIAFQKNILFAKKGVSNTIWIYNSDNNQIELYNYKSKKTVLTSTTITNFEPINMKSGLNFVKLIGNKKTLVFNRYLNLEETIIHKKNE